MGQHCTYRQGGERLERSPMEGDLGVLAGRKSSVSYLCALAAKRVNCTLGLHKTQHYHQGLSHSLDLHHHGGGSSANCR